MQELDWSSIPGALPVLARGMGATLEITAFAAAVGIAFGAALAVARLARRRWIAWPAAAYVNLFRSVPLVMVILWFYLLVPSLLKRLLGPPDRSDPIAAFFQVMADQLRDVRVVFYHQHAAMGIVRRIVDDGPSLLFHRSG